MSQKSGGGKNKKPSQFSLGGVSAVGGRRAAFPRSRAVSSPLRGLTSLFGMGRGAPPRIAATRLSAAFSGRGEGGHNGSRAQKGGSLRAISAARLNVSPRSHLRPIDVVVSDGPRRRPHLGAGFALRCPQRLSPPDAATRPCAWRRNRLTVGPSVPVLSY